MNIKINWTILTILLISIFAFTSGYLQNLSSQDADSLRFEKLELEKQLSLMQAKRDEIIDFDLDASNIAQLLYADAFRRALEYQLMNTTFTAIERQTKLALIITSLQLLFWNLNNTHAAFIQSEFEFNGKNGIIYANSIKDNNSGKEIGDGYDYIIQEQNWNSKNPGSFTTAELYLLETGFNDTTLSDLFFNFGSVFSKTDLVFVLNWPNIYKLHNNVIQIMFNKIEDINILASATQRISGVLSTSVSIATIGTVLSVAMINRASEKKTEESFSILRKEILKADGIEEFPKTKRSKIAILGLLFAFSIAVFGLVSAITFFLNPERVFSLPTFSALPF